MDTPQPLAALRTSGCDDMFVRASIPRNMRLRTRMSSAAAPRFWRTIVWGDGRYRCGRLSRHITRTAFHVRVLSFICGVLCLHIS